MIELVRKLVDAAGAARIALRSGPSQEKDYSRELELLRAALTAATPEAIRRDAERREGERERLTAIFQLLTPLERGTLLNCLSCAMQEGRAGDELLAGAMATALG